MNKILYCLLLVNTLINAQPIAWKSGTVVLADERVIAGQIHLDPSWSVVLTRKDIGAGVYSMETIHRIYYYDSQANINRKFLVVKTPRPELYEIVVDGPVKVIRTASKGVRKSGEDRLFTYYALFDDELISLSRFRSKLLPQLRTMTATQMAVRSQGDIIRFVQQVNSELQELNPLLARVD